MPQRIDLDKIAAPFGRASVTTAPDYDALAQELGGAEAQGTDYDALAGELGGVAEAPRQFPQMPSEPDEPGFREWYSGMATRYGLSDDPDDPSQFYDYRAAYRAGATPDASGHWPSTFKREGHPNMVVGGFHVQTGERVPGAPPATVAELIDLGWDETFARTHGADAVKPVASHGAPWMPKPPGAFSPQDVRPAPSHIQPEPQQPQLENLGPSVFGRSPFEQQGISPVGEFVRQGFNALVAQPAQSLTRIGADVGVLPEQTAQTMAARARELAPVVTESIIDNPKATLGNPLWWAGSGGQVAGSILSLLAAGEIGGMRAAVLGEALMEGTTAYDEARQAGASPEVAGKAAAAVTLANIPAIAASDLPLFDGPTKSAILNAVIRAASEGGQEATQEVIQDAAAQQTYDPERPWVSGKTLDAAVIGGVVGPLAGAGFDAAARAAQQTPAPQPPPLRVPTHAQAKLADRQLQDRIALTEGAQEYLNALTAERPAPALSTSAPPTDNIPPADLDALAEQMGGTVEEAAPAEPVTFTTAKGSRYTVSSAGTSRSKTATGEEFGPSDATVYLTPEQLDRAQAHVNTYNEGETTARPRVLDDGTVAIVVKDRATGQVRDDLSRRVDASREPAVGLHPFEVWNKNAAGERKWHFGNAITEIGGVSQEGGNALALPEQGNPFEGADTGELMQQLEGALMATQQGDAEAANEAQAIVTELQDRGLTEAQIRGDEPLGPKSVGSGKTEAAQADYDTIAAEHGGEVADSAEMPPPADSRQMGRDERRALMDSPNWWTDVAYYTRPARPPVSPLDYALIEGLHGVQGAAERLREAQQRGASDEELARVIGREFGIQGSSLTGKHGIPYYTVRGGEQRDKPSIEIRSSIEDKRTVVKGKKLLNAVRDLFGIGQPGRAEVAADLPEPPRRNAIGSDLLERALSPRARKALGEMFQKRTNAKDLHAIREAMEVYHRLREMGQPGEARANALRAAAETYFTKPTHDTAMNMLAETWSGLQTITGQEDPDRAELLENEVFADANEAGDLIFQTLDPKTASFDVEEFNTAYGMVEFRREPEQVFPTPEAPKNARTAKTPTLTQEAATELVAEWKRIAKATGELGVNAKKVIYSLFDVSGVISQPWVDAGYTVRRFDIKNGEDLTDFGMWMTQVEEDIAEGLEVAGVLAQPPCTSFAVSGARWWKSQHDIPNEEMVRQKYGLWAAERFDTPLDYANTLVAVVKLFVAQSNPGFYAMENPVGRIKEQNGLPKPTLVFDPHNYGDPYTKQTQLWGEFNADLPTANVEPTLGSLIHKLRGDVAEQKAQRSVTPEGFAYAFFMANDRSHAKIERKPDAAQPPAVTDGSPEAGARPAESGQEPQGSGASRPRPTKSQRRRELAEETARLEVETLDGIVDRAVRAGYAGDPDVLRNELRDRLKLIKELDEEYRKDGPSPDALLRQIRKYGGISRTVDEVYRGEVDFLRESFTKGTNTRSSAGIFNDKNGLSLDDMLTSLHQDAVWSHLRTISDLLEAIRAAASEPYDTRMYVDRLRAGLGRDWWNHLQPQPDTAPVSVEAIADEIEADERAAIQAEEGDDSFDTSTFEPPTMVDTLDTGEEQVRLPGAENVRQVGKADVSFQAPVQASGDDFSLTSENEPEPQDTTGNLFDQPAEPEPAPKAKPVRVFRGRQKGSDDSGAAWWTESRDLAEHFANRARRGKSAGEVLEESIDTSKFLNLGWKVTEYASLNDLAKAAKVSADDLKASALADTSDDLRSIVNHGLDDPIRVHALLERPGIQRVLAQAGFTGVAAKENISKTETATTYLRFPEAKKSAAEMTDEELAADIIADYEAEQAAVKGKEDKPAEQFDAAERGLDYLDMSEAELRELLDIGTGDQPQRAAAELKRRQDAEKPARTVDLKHSAERVPKLVQQIAGRKYQSVPPSADTVQGWFDELAGHLRDRIEGRVLTVKQLEQALTVFDLGELEKALAKLDVTLPHDVLSVVVDQAPKPTIAYNSAQRSVEVSFPKRPAASVLDVIRGAGFKWNKNTKQWYRRTGKAEAAALAEVRELLGVEAPATEVPKAPAVGDKLSFSDIPVGARVTVNRFGRDLPGTVIAADGGAHRVQLDAEGVVMESGRATITELPGATKPLPTVRGHAVQGGGIRESGVKAAHDAGYESGRDGGERNPPERLGPNEQAAWLTGYDIGRDIRVSPSKGEPVDVSGLPDKYSDLAGWPDGQLMDHNLWLRGQYAIGRMEATDPIMVAVRAEIARRGIQLFDLPGRTGWAAPKPKTPQLPPAAPNSTFSAPAGNKNADLDAKRAKNKAERDALIAQLKGNLKNNITSGPDPQNVLLMVKIVRTYIADAVLDFKQVARQFQEDFGEGARALDRHLEIAWEKLQGEKVSVAAALVENYTLMGVTVAPVHRQEIDGVRFELFRGDKEGVRRATDIESGKVFALEKGPFPTISAKHYGDISKAEQMARDPETARPVALMHAFATHVSNKTLPKDPREVRKIAQQAVGGDPTTYTDDITDAIEAALTRQMPAFKGTSRSHTNLASHIGDARILEDQLPRAARSLEKLELQQFSTPLPLAVAAQWAANVREGETVLEPTAGTGHLVSAIDPGRHTIKAVEFSPRRAALLTAIGFNVTNGDYLTQPLTESVDVIISNPPWGKYSTGKYGKPVALGFTPGDVAERFVAKMVRDLKPGGRLVAVMPTTMLGKDGLQFRTHLKRFGSIRALVMSPPNAYVTRSTSVESVLLVWDKIQGGAHADLVQTKGWDDYLDAVHAIPARETADAHNDRPAAPAPSGRPATPAGASSGSGRGGSGKSSGRGSRGSAAERGTPDVPAGRDTDVVAPEPAGPAVDRRPATPRLARPDDRESTRGLSGDALVAFRRAQDSANFAPYRLRSDVGGQRHPRLVVEARSLSGVDYPELTLSLSPRTRQIVESGRASIEQAEQAMAAVQANVLGQHGYLAADNVGVGKSREISLTILELMDRAKADGRELRLLVTTKSSDNITDLIEKELKQSILQGEDPGFEIVKVSEMKASKAKGGDKKYEPLPQYKHAIYVTDFYNLAPYREALKEVGLHGIVGDEAHRFKNADAAVGATWQTLHANIMLRVPRPHQAFAYFTATPAQSVYDYQYLYGLRLWPVDGFDQWVMLVTGQANEEQAEQLQQATDRGGIRLQAAAENAGDDVVGGDAEDAPRAGRAGGRNAGNDVFASALTPSEAEQIPREWKMLGRFSARDLWREGTEFVVHTAELPQVARERYDRFAQLARDIIDAAAQFGAMDRSGRASRFGPKSALQNAAKRIQMQPALEEAIRLAKEHLAQGYQPVLSLINVSEMDPNEGNIAAAINQINSREVAKTPDGGFEDLGEIPEALVRRAELLEQAQEIGTLDDPIQMIAQAFGQDNVAFVVGASAGTRQTQVAEFQAGKRKVAVISAAGATGISLHHTTFTDAGPARGRRVFIDVQYEWSASEAVQRYGRVDRSGQISSPKIIAANFGSAAEKKFLATVANRMASLGALSKGGAESTGANALEEFEITGQDALLAARNAWSAQDEADRDLWRGRMFRDPNHPEFPAAATRATMREINLALLWLPMDTANRFWQAFIEERARIREAMGYANEARTKALRGEIARETPIASDLVLYEVKNEAGHRFGILQGVVMPKMPRIRDYMMDADGRMRRAYVSFTETATGRVVSGLEVPITRVRGLAEEFGTPLDAQKLETPEQVETALNAGDKVTLDYGDPRWQIRLRQDKKIAIVGAKMADRELLLRHGATYSPVGNFWHVVDLPKFLDRFKPVNPENEARPKSEAMAAGTGQELEAIAAKGPSPAARPSAIVKQLSKALNDLPIRYGRMMTRNRGDYFVEARAARVRYVNDLRVVIHEAGHDFDWTILQIDRKDKRWTDELLELGQATSKPSYTKAQQLREGAAEFFVLYMANPAKAQERAPKYFEEVERKLALQPQLRDALHETRDNLQTYLGLSPADKGRSKIDIQPPPTMARRVGEALAAARDAEPAEVAQAVFQRILRANVDDLQPLKFAVETMRDGRNLPATMDAYVLARIARGATSKAQHFLERGVVSWDGRQLGPGLRDVLGKLSDEQERVLAEFLTAKTVQERLFTQPQKNAGLTKKEAEAIISETVKRPDFDLIRESAEQVWQFQEGMRTYMDEAGVLSRSLRDAMWNLYQRYVPIKRVMDDVTDAFGAGTAKRIANRRVPIYGYHGSSRDIINPLESVIQDTFAIVDMVEKNRAMQALTDLAANAAGSARFLMRVPEQKIATTFNLGMLSKDIARQLEENGLGDALPDNIEGALDAMVTVFTPATMPKFGTNLVTVIRDGRREWWEVNDKALYDAITAIGARDLNLVVKLWERPTRLLRATATATFGFVARNPARDTLTAWFQSNYGFIPGFDTMRGFISLVAGDEDARLFFSTGVAQAAMQSQDRLGRQQVIEQLGKSNREHARFLITHPLELIRAISEWSEASTRLGEFKLALDAGGQRRGVLERMTGKAARPALTAETVTRATLAARDVTTDFSRAGTHSREINAFYAFYNARVQGYARMGEALKNDPTGFTLKLATLGAVSMLLWLLHEDDDEYDEIPEWEKHTYWHLPAVTVPGLGRVFPRVPKPFEYGYVADVAEAYLQWQKKKDPSRWDAIKRNILGDATIQESLFNLLPTGLLPLVETAANYSSFRDAQIVRQWDLDLPTDLQYSEWTSETAKLLGKVIPVAPAHIDHLISGYTASVGPTVVKGVDAGLRAIGAAPPEKERPTIPPEQRIGVGTFVRAGAYGPSAQSLQDLYDLAEAIQRVNEGVKTDQKAGRAEEARARITAAEGDLPWANAGAILAGRNQLKAMSKEIRAIYDAPPEAMTPAQKRERLNRVYERMVAVARRALGRPTSGGH